MFQYMCYCGGNCICFCGGFLLPPISHASSSVVVNNFSSAKEQRSGNETQLQCVTTHGLSTMFHCTTGQVKDFTSLAGRGIKITSPIFKTEMLVNQSRANLGCVHTIPDSFRIGFSYPIRHENLLCSHDIGLVFVLFTACPHGCVLLRNA